MVSVIGRTVKSWGTGSTDPVHTGKTSSTSSVTHSRLVVPSPT